MTALDGDGDGAASTYASLDRERQGDVRLPIKELPDEPERYPGWRFGVTAIFMAVVDPGAAEEYWKDIEEYLKNNPNPNNPIDSGSDAPASSHLRSANKTRDFSYCAPL